MIAAGKRFSCWILRWTLEKNKPFVNVKKLHLIVSVSLFCPKPSQEKLHLENCWCFIWNKGTSPNLPVDTHKSVSFPNFSQKKQPSLLDLEPPPACECKIHPSAHRRRLPNGVSHWWQRSLVKLVGLDFSGPTSIRKMYHHVHHIPLGWRFNTETGSWWYFGEGFTSYWKRTPLWKKKGNR